MERNTKLSRNSGFFFAALVLSLLLIPAGAFAQDEVPGGTDDEAQPTADESSPEAAAETPEPVETAGPTELAAEPEIATAAEVGAAQVATVDEKAEEAESLPVAGYKKGFFIQSPNGKFKLAIGSTMQPHFAWESAEEHVEETDETTGDTVVLKRTEREPEYAFLIKRAELKLKGHAFSENVSYGIMADFAKGTVALKDYYIDFALAPKVFHMRFGSYKKPFSRQQLTSSSKLELVDRSITDKAFGQGRDIGLMFHNKYTKSPAFEWALGVFNGTGEKPWFEGKFDEDEDGNIEGISSKSKYTNVPDKFHPLVVARIGYNHGDLKGYSEADLEGGPFRLGLGLSGIADFDSDDDDDSNIRGEFDFIIKAAGFSTTGGVYVMTAQDGAGFSDQAFNSWGLHAQAGYVINGMVQPAFRYALVDLDGDYNKTQELTGGLAVYIFNHNLKWQTDFGGRIYEHEMGDLTDYVVRSQVSLAF